jgi:cobalt/nickel transport system permease protein
MNMIYRFIFVLMDTQASMQTAARSRLGYQGFKTSCRTFGLIGASLLVVSMKKAGAYYDALIARGYEGQLLFLEEEKSVNGTQILAFIGFFLLIALVIWLT